MGRKNGLDSLFESVLYLERPSLRTCGRTVEEYVVASVEEYEGAVISYPKKNDTHRETGTKRMKIYKKVILK